MAIAGAACSSSLCPGSSRPFENSNQSCFPYSVLQSVSCFPRVFPFTGLSNHHTRHFASPDRRLLPSHSKLLVQEDKKPWLDCFWGLLNTNTEAGIWILHDLKRLALLTDLKRLYLALSRNLDASSELLYFKSMVCFYPATMYIDFQHRTCKKESLKEEVWLGYWVGPDDVDGWGFVEAFLAPS